MHKHLLLLSLLITGCADLADLQPDGTCGNKILEANANEDCDGFALGDGLSCGQPSTAGACRYVCRPLVLGTACPAGWGCGIDGICRAPGPGLTESANRVILPVTLARDLKVADVDGDRRMDVTGLIGPEVRVLYGDSRGAFEQKATLTVGTPLGEILVEDLDSDQRADLVVPQIPGPLVVRGRADGALEPIPYGAVVASPDYLDRPGFRVLTVRSDEPELETSFTIATTFSDRVEMEFPRAMTSAVAPGVRAKIEGASELATNIPVESKTAGAPMRTDGVDRVALSFSFTNTIYVLQTRCARPGAGLVCAVEGVEAVALFPSATITEGAHFADVNGDGQMDLIGLGDGTEGAMVAFGRPNGRFCPTLGPCATSSMRRLEFFDRVGNPVMGHGPLLAVGDVDEDRFSDYVFAEGVVTVTGTITPNGDISARATAVATPRAQASWTAAAIGDFNRDGFADVATAYPGENGVEFLIGTGRRFFNRQRTPTTSPPDSIVGLIVGDFDGDLFQDVAVAQEDGAVSVLYGDPQGAPDDVVSMGKFNAVSGLAAGDLAIPGEAQQDLVTDLIVVSSSTGRRCAHQSRDGSDRYRRTSNGCAADLR